MDKLIPYSDAVKAMFSNDMQKNYEEDECCIQASVDYYSNNFSIEHHSIPDLMAYYIFADKWLLEKFKEHLTYHLATQLFHQSSTTSILFKSSRVLIRVYHKISEIQFLFSLPDNKQLVNQLEIALERHKPIHDDIWDVRFEYVKETLMDKYKHETLLKMYSERGKFGWNLVKRPWMLEQMKHP